MALRGTFARRVGKGAVAALLAAAAAVAAAASSCTNLGYNNYPAARQNKLFLYFPALDDVQFLEFGQNGWSTSPARRFDTASLGSYTGSPNDLQLAIAHEVTDLFCGFNVEVLTTSAPVAAPARRAVVAIGTDAAVVDCTKPQFGEAERVDTGDAFPVEYGRVWAGSYQTCAGVAGGELEGAKSTLERWAASIGGSAAHEAGHTFGVGHLDGTKLGPSEDSLRHHLMAEGRFYSWGNRAVRRHFSDWEYAVIAGNIGLSVQTLFDWSLVNPNGKDAAALKLEVLSQQPNLTLAASYVGQRSPWGTPTVGSPLGTQNFKGVSYNRYQILWSVAKAWDGGPAGIVPAGASFVVGTSFVSVDPSVPDPVIVTGVTLFDASSKALDLRPRIPGFNAGSFDPRDGTFVVEVYNNGETPLEIVDGSSRTAPRMVSIDAMLDAERPTDLLGRAVFTRRHRVLLDKPSRVPPRGELRLPIARLREGRETVRIIREADDCDGRDTMADGRDTGQCVRGFNLGLFPDTVTLLTANIVERFARQWDAKRERYVVAPMRTTVWYQMGGRHPDLDRNGADDFIDITTGAARDANGDGVVDHVQVKRSSSTRVTSKELKQRSLK